MGLGGTGLRRGRPRSEPSLMQGRDLGAPDRQAALPSNVLEGADAVLRPPAHPPPTGDLQKGMMGEAGLLSPGQKTQTSLEGVLLGTSCLRRGPRAQPPAPGRYGGSGQRWAACVHALSGGLCGRACL